MSYDYITVTITNASGEAVAVQQSGKTTPSVAANGTEYEGTHLSLNRESQILSLTQTTGAVVHFAANAQVSVALSSPASSSSSSS